MAIAFDAAVNYPSTGGAVNSHTFSHTITGANPILFVGFMHYVDNTDIVTGVTYNSVAMTRVASVVAGGGAGARVYLYVLRAPSTGANNVVISLNTTRDVYGGAMSYTGVAQSGAVDSFNTGQNAGGTSLAVSTTTVADNCWITGVYASASGRVLSPGANTTERFDNSAAVCGDDSNAAKTPPGAYSLTVNQNAGDNGCMVVASFEPPSDALFSPKIIIF